MTCFRRGLLWLFGACLVACSSPPRGIDAGRDAADVATDGGPGVDADSGTSGQQGSPCRSTAVCASGLICFGGECQSDPCLSAPCPAPETCQAACVPTHDPCLGVTCPVDQTCVRGACVAGCFPQPCGGACPDGQICLNTAGLFNCTPVNDCNGFGVCPAGFACQRTCAARTGPCADVQCAANEVCTNGVCHVDPCAGVTCAPGSLCENGTCVDTCVCNPPCMTAEGFQCLGGACVCPPGQACCDPPCPTGLVCAPGSICACPPRTGCPDPSTAPCGTNVPGSIVPGCCGQGTACPSDTVCTGGRCICPSCPAQLDVACGTTVQPSGCATPCPVGLMCSAGAGCIQDPATMQLHCCTPDTSMTAPCGTRVMDGCGGSYLGRVCPSGQGCTAQHDGTYACVPTSPCSPPCGCGQTCSGGACLSLCAPGTTLCGCSACCSASETCSGTTCIPAG